MDFDAVD